MKLAYFHLLTADNDDADLGAAKVYGYVPEKCLLGGTLVWKHVAAEKDPCHGCGGPRARCGGRPKLTSQEEYHLGLAQADPFGLLGMVDRDGE